MSDERRCAGVNKGRSPTLAAAAAALARVSSLNDSICFFFLNFAKNVNAILKDSTGMENQTREREREKEREELENTKWCGVRGTDKVIRGERERERERERQESSCIKEES